MPYDVFIAQADEEGETLHKFRINYVTIHGTPYITLMIWNDHQADRQ